MSLNISQLPPAPQITSTPIREAVEKLAAAGKVADEAKKTLTQLGHELPAAQQADADKDAELRAAGKPALKGRPATEKHEKAIADAEHEVRVTTALVKRERAAADAVVAEHGAAYVASVEKELADLDRQFSNAVEVATETHSKRITAISLARKLGSKHLGVQASYLDRRQLPGIELPPGAPTSFAVDGFDLLDAVARLGTEQAQPEPVRTGMTDQTAANIASAARPFRDTDTAEHERQRSTPADQRLALDAA